jgi:hypothetical protein
MFTSEEILVRTSSDELASTLPAERDWLDAAKCLEAGDMIR